MSDGGGVPKSSRTVGWEGPDPTTDRRTSRQRDNSGTRTIKKEMRENRDFARKYVKNGILAPFVDDVSVTSLVGPGYDGMTW